ncbi:MAG: esterase/lipase family protein [Ktedonobacterales bacterium]
MATRPEVQAPHANNLTPFPPGYAPNIFDMDQSGFQGDSQTSDPITGWGDDVWSFNFSVLTQITVEVDDCCLVGDNYEVYITRNLTTSEDLIGTTPPEDINGTELSTGTFSKLVAPGPHYVAIRDPGGVYWYSQGYTTLANPAGYAVTISVRDASQAASPAVPHPVVFVHGINTNSNNPGFGPLLSGLKKLYDPQVQNFAYVDDQSLTDQSACRRYTPDGCVSQSAMLPNAVKLAAMVKQLAAGAGGHKVTVIGYSQGAAIIRTMLDGCMSEIPNASTPGCGGVAPLVDNVFFINGVQQGSWLAASDTNLTAIAQEQGLSDVSALNFLPFLKAPGAALLHLNPSDPAEVDLAPQSANIRTRNAVTPPNGIHYFNFYGDIRIQQQTQALIWNVSAAQTVSIGDLVVLPGSDNPQDVSLAGGARFCLQCTDRGGFSFSAIDANTTYTEWPLTDVINWNPNLLFNFLFGLEAIADVALLEEIQAAPMMHTTIPTDGALNSIMVRDTTGFAGQVTIPTEIALQLEQEDGIEP